MRVSTAILALGSATSAFAALSLTAPSSVNQCQDATFQISGNTGAVMFSVVPSVDPCQHDALLELGPFQPTDGSYTWHNVNITSGTPVLIVIDDESQQEAWSQVITIGGDSSHCSSSSSSGSGNSASQTTAHANNAATGTAAARATNTGSSAPVNAGSSTNDNTSGAISMSGSPQIGIAALLAGAAVAFLA